MFFGLNQFYSRPLVVLLSKLFIWLLTPSLDPLLIRASFFSINRSLCLPFNQFVWHVNTQRLPFIKPSISKSYIDTVSVCGLLLLLGTKHPTSTVEICSKDSLINKSRSGFVTGEQGCRLRFLENMPPAGSRTINCFQIIWCMTYWARDDTFGIRNIMHAEDYTRQYKSNNNSDMLVFQSWPCELSSRIRNFPGREQIFSIILTPHECATCRHPLWWITWVIVCNCVLILPSDS